MLTSTLCRSNTIFCPSHYFDDKQLHYGTPFRIFAPTLAGTIGSPSMVMHAGIYEHCLTKKIPKTRSAPLLIIHQLLSHFLVVTLITLSLFLTS